MHLIGWTLVLVLVVWGLRAWRARVLHRRWLARTLEVGAGLSHGIPRKRRSLWDFLRYG